MKRLLAPAILVILTLALALTSCDGSNNSYPEKYIGFEKSECDLAYRENDEQVEMQVKIIAVDKSKEDRVVLIESPQSSQSTIKHFFRIKESRITIPAGKKSAKATITVYPKNLSILRKLQLICRPQTPGAEASKLIIRLVKK